MNSKGEVIKNIYTVGGDATFFPNKTGYIILTDKQEIQLLSTRRPWCCEYLSYEFYQKPNRYFSSRLFDMSYTITPKPHNKGNDLNIHFKTSIGDLHFICSTRHDCTQRTEQRNERKFEIWYDKKLTELKL